MTKQKAVSTFFVMLFALSPLSVPGVAALDPSSEPLAATPLTDLEANWEYTAGNEFAHSYSPQKQINSSNAKNLGIHWLWPVPSVPLSLGGGAGGVFGGVGVDTTPLIVNGTIYAVTQWGQITALNAANGNVIWTTVLPINLNSTAGQNAGSLLLHLHQGEQAFTTTDFGWNSGGTATYWISAPDHKVYAIDALTGKYQMNFSYYENINSVDGNSPTSVYASLANNVLIDQQRGIMVTAMHSSSNSNGGRCYYRGFDILVNPPQPIWTSYCSPPQPKSNVPLDPYWTIKQVNGMIGAQVFYPATAYDAGGRIPGTAVVDLKTLSSAQLNDTLYDDWGYVNQSTFCLAATDGASTGSTGAGWGGTWVLDEKTGIAYVNTGNRGPYAGACNPGPDLWASSALALNDQTGEWVWGFQTSAHDNWDWDCAWFQALGNETIDGANTQVLWKTCKNGYLYELNAATGTLVWAWTPPFSILPRCQYCYMQDPLNRTQMTNSWAAPGLQDFVANPSELAGFESTGAYNPDTNMVYVTSHNTPAIFQYVPVNFTNYFTTSGINVPGGQPNPRYTVNATIEAVDASTGQMVWSHDIPSIGFRGGLMTSGNIVFAPLVTGDLLMLDAQTGAVVSDLFVGAPMSVVPSIGATIAGQMTVIVPVGSASFFGNVAPGDLIALTLQPVATTTTTATTTATATVTTTSVSTSTLSAGETVTTTMGESTITMTGPTTTVTTSTTTGVDATTLYAVIAVAVIFIIALGYLVIRGREPVH